MTQNQTGLLPFFIVSLALLFSACTPRYHTQFELGDKQTLTALYSYPNNPAGDETLADTLRHYMQQTAARDGLRRAQVHVSVSKDLYTVGIRGRDAWLKQYPDRVSTFLRLGSVAHNGAEELEQTPIWQADWRFFLPLGLAMVQQRSVQLLHFPPDYSLTEQDYLNSNTSRRWESLLEVNGAAPKEVARYETIIDIAPIAAPASDGSKLEGSYAYFSDYAHKLLGFLAGSDGGGPIKPVVAYGTPVREWVKDQFGVSLTVLGTGYLPLDAHTKVPVLGANHPSYFWYAAEQSCDDGWDVMRQDLIAARWQLKMSASPDADPHKVSRRAEDYWDARDAAICELTVEQYAGCKGKPMTHCTGAQNSAETSQ